MPKFGTCVNRCLLWFRAYFRVLACWLYIYVCNRNDYACSFSLCIHVMP